MANTYTQIYIHIIFAVQGRHNFLPKKHLESGCRGNFDGKKVTERFRTRVPRSIKFVNTF